VFIGLLSDSKAVSVWTQNLTVACLTLALVHILVWLKEPTRRTYLLFFIGTSSVAVISLEISFFTSEEYSL
jgi:hypothetical protein